ncbi:hypothetical protein ACFP9U_12560, partial [Nitratireductor sp. GCM10026969]
GGGSAGGGGGGLGGGGSLGGSDYGSVVASMTDAELIRNKKLCGGILANPNGWDYDLVQLCKVLRMASR